MRKQVFAHGTYITFGPDESVDAELLRALRDDLRKYSGMKWVYLWGDQYIYFLESLSPKLFVFPEESPYYKDYLGMRVFWNRC